MVRSRLRLGGLLVASVLLDGLLLNSAILNLASAGDWPSFRGPHSTGISDETTAPLRWSKDENIAWCVQLPGPGNSSPIVVGERVFITCASDRGKLRGTYCFRRSDGAKQWEQIVRYEAEDPTHGTNPYCGSSPVAAGERVVVWHGSAGVHCYDLAGRPQWSRDLGVFRHIWGYGSSPVIHGNVVLLNCGPGPRQFVIALDLATGKTLWQYDIPNGYAGDEDAVDGKQPWIASWSTPVVAQVEGTNQVLVGLPYRAQAFELTTGKPLWHCEGLGDLVYTDVLVSKGLGVLMGGYHGPAIGFQLGGSGDVTATNRLWQHTSKNPQRVGSGVIVGEHLYIVNEVGLVQCLEVASGRETWRMPVRAGKNWSSLIAVAGRLYYSTQQGTTVVLAPNPERLEVLVENQLGEGTNSTIAPAYGQLFHRTYEHLWCIGKQPTP